MCGTKIRHGNNKQAFFGRGFWGSVSHQEKMESNKKNGKLEQKITSAPSLGCHKMEVMPNKDFEYVGALFLVFLEIFECGCFDGQTCLESIYLLP